MREHGSDWPAYTVGYGESFEDDELVDAAESARLLGGRHIPVQLDRREFENALPMIVGCLEEPIASSSIVPMYFVSRRARGRRQGRDHRPGARRAVLRLQTPPRDPLRRHLAKAAERRPAGDRVRRQPAAS